MCKRVVPAEAGTQVIRVLVTLQTWVPACAGTTGLLSVAVYSDSAANALSRTCSTGPTPEILRYFGAPGKPDSAHLP